MTIEPDPTPNDEQPQPSRRRRLRDGIATARQYLRPVVHFTRHWFKELFIATVLAVVAAILLERYSEHRHQQILDQNRQAVAMIIASKDGKAVSQGSGVFINAAGLLLTNYHVVAGADSIIAKLPTGAFYQATDFKGAFQAADVAVLQFDAQGTPCVHQLGDSAAISAGDKVLAIGAPIGLDNSVSEGIISNPKRPLRGVTFIQFTAPISPGSSGGGLFDIAGALLGLTSDSIAGTMDEPAQNLNFAIPINLVRDAIDGKSDVLTEGHPEYYYSRGNLAAKKHEFEQAIADYRRAIEIDAKYVDAYLELGGIYYEEGRYDLEAAYYEKAVELNPQDYEAQYYLATAYEDQGRYLEAIERYKTVLALSPTYKDAMHDLALLYMSSGQKVEASDMIVRLKRVDAGLGRKLELLLARISHR